MKWIGRISYLVFRSVLLCCLLGSASLLGSIETSAAEPVDLIALRDAICAWETRGSKDPDAEVGTKSELGRCQIRLGTARGLGFIGHPAKLFDRDVNEYWALVKLVKCGQPLFRREMEDGKWKYTLTRQGYVTVKGLAFCFNRGLWAGKLKPKDEYVVNVERIYQEMVKP